MFLDLVQKEVSLPIITDRHVAEADVSARILHCKDMTEAKTHWNKEKLVILGDYSLEPGLIKEIALKKKLTIVIPASPLMRTQGLSRALLIRKIRTFVSFCIKQGLACRLVSYAQKEGELRSERELIHIGCLLGLTVSQAKKMVGLPEGFLQPA